MKLLSLLVAVSQFSTQTNSHSLLCINKSRFINQKRLIQGSVTISPFQSGSTILWPKRVSWKESIVIDDIENPYSVIKVLLSVLHFHSCSYDVMFTWQKQLRWKGCFAKFFSWLWELPYCYLTSAMTEDNAEACPAAYNNESEFGRIWFEDLIIGWIP